MAENGKRERPLYVPPARRDESGDSTLVSVPTKSRLQVKLDIKKEKIIHAWEKEDKEKSKEKIVHAWEETDQKGFKLPPRPKYEKSKTKVQSHQRNNDKQGLKSRRIKTESKASASKSQNVTESTNIDEKESKITFVNAEKYLEEMATSDWNDLDSLDYSKVPKWNH